MTFNRLRLSEEEAQSILAQGRWGVLSTAAADGQPYGVPLNYVYDRPRLFYCRG